MWIFLSDSFNESAYSIYLFEIFLSLIRRIILVDLWLFLSDSFK